MCAGVLAFTAAEGTVGMPPQVARNVFGDGTSVPPEGATVDVLYKRLPKGAMTNLFHRPWPTCLHACLGIQMCHSAVLFPPDRWRTNPDL